MNCSRVLAVGVAITVVVVRGGTAAEVDPEKLRDAVTLYASFDKEIRADVGGGNLAPATRFDHPSEKGKYIFKEGLLPGIFRIAKGKGIHGGALEGVDVMPRRGRIFFPAKGNLAFESNGWNGAASVWLNTDPNKLLETEFCDPIQITHKGAGNGGLWIDFPNVKPRDFRLGAFPAVAEGAKPIPESDPRAPLIRVKEIGFKSGIWHHVVMNWKNLDTGKNNALVALYIDGKLIGELKDRELAMRWDLDRTGIYFAVNYIGLLDELTIFNRSLSDAEIRYLTKNPACIAPIKKRRGNAKKAAEQLKVLSARSATLVDKGLPNLETDELRSAIHQFLNSRDGREVAAQVLGLLVQLMPRRNSPTAPTFPFDPKSADRYQREYSAWSGLPLDVTNHAGMSFKLIPPGDFVMGSPQDEPGHRESSYDETQHPVRLTDPFYLSKHETTVAQFREFVEATFYETDGEKNGGGHAHDAKAVWKHRPGTSWRKPGYAGPYKLHDDHPVVHVSHSDSMAFCRWLQKHHVEVNGKDKSGERLLPRYDLPTEAQWEWACRAGSGTRFWWGENADDSGKVINVGDRKLKQVHPQWPREIMPMDDGHAFPAPVGIYRANAFGLHDMLGNVWEFCSTRYGKFPTKLSVDPGHLDPKRGFAVRGGGWSNKPTDARCATRNADPPHFCHSNLGFRAAIKLPITDH